MLPEAQAQLYGAGAPVTAGIAILLNETREQFWKGRGECKGNVDAFKKLLGEHNRLTYSDKTNSPILNYASGNYVTTQPLGMFPISKYKVLFFERGKSQPKYSLIVDILEPSRKLDIKNIDNVKDERMNKTYEANSKDNTKYINGVVNTYFQPALGLLNYWSDKNLQSCKDALAEVGHPLPDPKDKANAAQ